MQPADARSPGGVGFPTQDSPARSRASSPTKPETPPYRSPSTLAQRGAPKIGSRSTSFAIVHESPHKPSLLGPGSATRRRVVTQSSAVPKRGAEREPSGFAGDLFGGFGGEDLYLGPDDSAVAEDVQRLLESKANRQRTKDSLTASQGSLASTVRSQIAPPPPQRPFPTKAQTSPAAVIRSLPSSPSKPQTPQQTLRPTTSTEALVFYETPTASSSKTTLDWSGYNPPEQTAPKKHRRTFSLTRKQKPPKKAELTSDTGDEADNFEASLKAIRDRTSEGTWSKVSLAKQELASRYSTFYNFLNDYKRAFNPAEVVRWRARNKSNAPLDGLISTASLPSFAAADPALLLSLDDKLKNRFRITSPIVHEWLEAEVNPPGAHDLMPSQKTIRGPPIKTRPRGASLSIQQGLDAGAAVGGSPSDSGRRVTRLSHPGTSLDSLKGPLNAMLAGVGRRDRAENADHSVASLSKISAAAKRAFRREASPTRRPGSTVNSDDESGASQRRKVSFSRPPTPDTRQVDSATDDDARSGMSFGHLAKKSLHNLFGMTRDGDKHSHGQRDKLSEMLALQLSPAASIDGVGKTAEDLKALRSPYLLPPPNWRKPATTRSSEDYTDNPQLRQQYRQKARTIETLRREADTAKRFLESVADSLREYAKLEKTYCSLFGGSVSVIDEHILSMIDFDPFAPPRAQRKPLASTSWRAAEDVASRIRNQRAAIDAFLAHYDQHLLPRPAPEFGESLASLLETLHDLECEREAITRARDQLAQLRPVVDSLYDELAREADAVGMLAAQSYGVKTATTHLATSPFEMAAARSLEFLLNWFAGLYRSFMTRKRYILPLIVISAVIVFGTSGWLHYVVLYLWETMIAFVIVLGVALFASALGTFVVRGGFANAPTFAS